MEKEWLKVIAASLLEMIWVTGLAHASSFLEWCVTSIGVVGSFYLLTSAIKRLPIGTVYAVFAGLGSVGSIIVGVVFFKEPLSVLKVVCMLTLIAGIIGLKLIESPNEKEEFVANATTAGPLSEVPTSPVTASSTTEESDEATSVKELTEADATSEDATSEVVGSEENLVDTDVKEEK